MNACVVAAVAAFGLGFAGVAEAAPGDGVVDAVEVCQGGADLSWQDEMRRPYGGVLLVPPTLTAAQGQALKAAAAIRLTNSQGQAVWRVVRAIDVLEVGDDAVLVAACSVGDYPNTGPTWSFGKPAGGLAVDWGALSSVEWLAGELQNLEGNE